MTSFYEVLGLTALLWFLGKFIRYAFPPLFETLQEAYVISTTQIGLAFSGFMLLYALLQFPSGALADRFGATLVITGGAMVAAIGAATMLFRPPFALLVVAMAVIGAGTGAHKTVAVRLLSNVYPSRFGRTLGIFDTVGASGGVVAPIIVAGILGLALVNWQVLFGITAFVFALIGLGFFHRMTRIQGVDVPSAESVLPWRTYTRTFRRGKLLGFMGVTVLVAFTYNGLVAFLPLMLTVEGGLSPAMASLLYSVLFLASVSQLATGEAADRFGPLPTVTVCLVAATLSLVALVGLLNLGYDLTTPLGLAALGGVILSIGLGAHGYRPARDVYIVGLVPAATTGGSLGVVRTVLMVSAALAPGVIGFVADRYDFLIAFSILAGVATLAVVLVLVIAHLERREIS